jgi:hypothetical protein
MTRQEAIEQRGIRFFRVSSEAVENDMDGVLTSLAAFIPLGES